MAKNTKMYSDVGPSHEEAFEAGYENSAMASSHFDWKTDIKAVVGPVVAQPHEEVDEVHQGDSPIGGLKK